MPGDHLIAYDAECGPCSRFKALIRFLDARGRLEFASLREADEAGALSDVEPSLRYRSFHLVSSGRQVRSGSEAIIPLLGLLVPGGERLTNSLEIVPGFHRAMTFGYATLSRLHDTGSCGTAAR